MPTLSCSIDWLQLGLANRCPLVKVILMRANYLTLITHKPAAPTPICMCVCKWSNHNSIKIQVLWKSHHPNDRKLPKFYYDLTFILLLMVIWLHKQLMECFHIAKSILFYTICAGGFIFAWLDDLTQQPFADISCCKEEYENFLFESVSSLARHRCHPYNNSFTPHQRLKWVWNVINSDLVYWW